MAQVLITESYLEDIGDAIRAKLETQDTYKPSEMATAIGQISGGATLVTKNITQNGTYNAIDDEADGYSSVVVDVAGGGSTTYTGSSDPSPLQGSLGDYYIKYFYFNGAIPTTTRSYTLNITGGLRGGSTLNYVGAQEIQLFYDDGEGNEVNIRTLSDFVYSGKNGSSGNANPGYAFDGNTAGTYWEANPTPVTVNFSAIVPQGYTLKKFVVWQRNSTTYNDVWSDFELTETIHGSSRTLLTESGLTVSDWAGAGNGTEWSLENVPGGIGIMATYVKVGASEQAAEWVEAPIVVFLDGYEENLYANGTFYESFAPFSAQSNNQTFTVNTNSLEFTRVAHGSTGFIYYTANKIDLTDVKEIVMNASVSFGYEHKDGNYYPHLGIFSAVSGWNSYTMVAETPIHEGINSTILDVSNLSGEYYVGIYGYALTATVSQIFLYKETNIA